MEFEFLIQIFHSPILVILHLSQLAIPTSLYIEIKFIKRALISADYPFHAILNKVILFLYCSF